MADSRPNDDVDPARHWEQRYAESTRMWSGTVNATTAAVVAELTPGTALDLGCGEGADAIWMAEWGWRVTAVDLSATAIARGRAVSDERGLGDAITWVAADLQTWAPDGQFDLVAASFLHSDVAFDRAEVLRRAAGWVAPGGHLLLVSHAGVPPWADTDHHHADLPTPEQEWEQLALPAAQWRAAMVQTRPRDATGPDGTAVRLEDGVLLLRHAAPDE